VTIEHLSLLPLLLIAVLAVPLSWIDIREHRLPNSYTYPTLVFTVGCLSVVTVWTKQWQDLAAAISAGALTFFVGYLLARAGAIGMGDIKLLTSMHAALAWQHLMLPLLSLSAGLLIATVYGLVGMVAGKFKPTSLIPLGPFLLIGFLGTSVLPVRAAIEVAWS
jgi:leader peptidase (prepilin peptidase)/N-methyltransferase